MLFRIMLLWIFLCTGAKFSFGQQRKIDSLNKVIANFKKHDTLKLKLMGEVADLVLSTNPKKGLQLVKEIQVIAAKVNFPKYIVSGMLLEGKYYFISYKLDSALYFFEKAKAYATSLNNKTFVARSNTAIASVLLMKGKPTEAIALYEDCIKVFAAEKNYEVLWLGVWEHNYNAQSFYKKWGFIDTCDSHPFPIGNTPQTDNWMIKFIEKR